MPRDVNPAVEKAFRAACADLRETINVTALAVSRAEKRLAEREAQRGRALDDHSPPPHP